ncbi:asparagine synthase [Desulfoluna butyratoxydans]|uniref:asparagine synthase (glutamine-hydrolyzing) n=1 Tax=Desulfoluna butyratoxydans TaxID=231438 RepID=A0A4U8YMF6_9BACT|nr:asparagine synthase [Desulfoluna butyratoxydans]
MSLLFGMYRFGHGDVSFEPFKKTVLSVLSAKNRNTTTYEIKRFCLLKVDYGLFSDSGYHADVSGDVCAVAGEPFFNHGTSSDRYAQLRALHHRLQQGSIDVLNGCTGTYSLCAYNRENHSLTLATDKVGVRPIYYAAHNGTLYFSSSLKVMEALEEIPKVLKFRQCIEKCSLGYTLGANTIYEDIRVLRDGEHLKAEGNTWSTNYYFKWGDLSITQKDAGLLRKEVYDAFFEAVKKRAVHRDEALAFLSGGLDSRCIVAVLSELNKKVYAINSYAACDQDNVFAEMYGTAARVHRYVSTKREGRVDSTEKLLASTIGEAEARERWVQRMPAIFSGDGGSVGLGHVYIDSALNTLMARDESAGIEAYLQGKQFPLGILRKKHKKTFENSLYESVSREFGDLKQVDPSRRLYVFLMRNDQRCHLHGYFDNIDVYQKEMLLPFFDSDFLALIARAPVDGFLYHTFYHEWLQLFPAHVTAVPWQTYPGHVPCDIRFEKELSDQWEQKARGRALGHSLSLLSPRKASSRLDAFVPKYKRFSVPLLQIIGSRRYRYLSDIFRDLSLMCARATEIDLS